MGGSMKVVQVLERDSLTQGMVTKSNQEVQPNILL